MREPGNQRARVRVLVFVGLAACLLLGPGEEAPRAQSAAWVGQVIAKYNFETHHAGLDFSQLQTGSYDVIVGGDGTPNVSGNGRMSTKWSVTWLDKRRTYTDACGPRSITQQLDAYGSGDGEGTTLRVTYASGGYSIAGDTSAVEFEILTELQIRHGACQLSQSLSSTSAGAYPFSTFVPSPADDRWVITGTFNGSVGSNLNSCSGSTCQKNTVTVRLRRANCTDAPDADGDGLNICQEFDHRTDPSRWDTDGGGVSDGDEVSSGTDPHNPEDDAQDPDRDGIPTGAPDNCPTLYNPGQANLDGDGQGDVCDPDRDGDGLDNTSELDKGTNPDDPDHDDDTVPDGPDQCPLNVGPPPTGCSGGKLRVTLKADYQTYWYSVPVPILRDKVLNVIIDGASSVTVTGDATAVSMVQSACLESLSWDAYFRFTFDTVGAVWNEGGRQITGSDPEHFVLWDTFPRNEDGKSTLQSKVKWCAPGLSVRYSTSDPGRGDLEVVPLSGSIAKLTHHLEGSVTLTDGRTFRCERRLSETEKAPRRLLDVKRLDEEQSCDLVF